MSNTEQRFTFGLMLTQLRQMGVKNSDLVLSHDVSKSYSMGEPTGATVRFTVVDESGEEAEQPTLLPKKPKKAPKQFPTFDEFAASVQECQRSDKLHGRIGDWRYFFTPSTQAKTPEAYGVSRVPNEGEGGEWERIKWGRDFDTALKIAYDYAKAEHDAESA